MTEVNPCGFLQNAGTTHTAEITRNSTTSILSGAAVATSLKNFGGVHPHLGNLFKVQQAGSPNMSVDVLSGVAYIPGTEGSKQGTYAVLNDGTVNKTIAASDPSLPRIDIVVLKVQDSFYSGATNSWSIAVVTGTPAGSPSAPAAPANSITIARVAVGAGVTSIVNANITDSRSYAAAIGGTITCTSTTRPGWVSSTVGLGQMIYETDTGFVYVWKGTAWTLIPLAGTGDVVFARKTADETVNNSATLQNDDHLFFTVAANIIYEIEGALFYNSGTTPDMKMGWTFPTGLTMKWVMSGYDPSGTTFTADARSQTDVVGFFGAGALDYTLLIRGIVIVSSTAGTLQMQWAQNTANASNSIIRQNSYLKLTRIT